MGRPVTAAASTAYARIVCSLQKSIPSEWVDYLNEQANKHSGGDREKISHSQLLIESELLKRTSSQEAEGPDSSPGEIR